MGELGWLGGMEWVGGGGGGEPWTMHHCPWTMAGGIPFERKLLTARYFWPLVYFGLSLISFMAQCCAVVVIATDVGVDRLCRPLSLVFQSHNGPR